MRITSKGQVTIPQAIREELGLLRDTEVEFAVDGDAVRIVKSADPSKRTRGQGAVARLRGTGSVKMTTDEILALTRKDR
ncbi:MAG: AbrB/MazE/SpoVT family DNA-binding domain-containing protein [Candidatus Wallbacteria bacterium]|nr:AbrB/MazE/SpoVT family DNA-binding domain-containing protein [Candidatus Wallbacteria bacterium]